MRRTLSVQRLSTVALLLAGKEFWLMFYVASSFSWFFSCKKGTKGNLMHSEGKKGNHPGHTTIGCMALMGSLLGLSGDPGKVKLL